MMLPAVLMPHELLNAVEKPGLETVTGYRLNPEDWLVLCGGFEDRAIGVLNSALGAQTPFNVLLIKYEPHLPANKVDEIRAACSKAGVAISEAIYNIQRPMGIGEVLEELLSECQGRVIVDVSAMSRLLIVQVMVALGARPDGFADCYVAYAQATDYPPTRSEAEAKLAESQKDQTYGVLFLSSGVFDVTVVPELSSSAMTGEQNRLAMFPSLDAHHLIALRTELQPSRYSFIEGVPPDGENHWRKMVIANLNHLDQIGEAERFETSTLWYQETLDCLIGIYSKHSLRERLMIAPTGSKMQAVAVGIFRSFVQDVQIVHPTPRGFCDPSNYTHGVGKLHLLSLSPFSGRDPSE
jgi:hypothetical protein